MRKLFELSDDEEWVCEAYARLDEARLVGRASDEWGTRPLAYARALLADGLRKGWLRAQGE